MVHIGRVDGSPTECLGWVNHGTTCTVKSAGRFVCGAFWKGLLVSPTRTQDAAGKLWREANGGAQCGKSARCVRRGGGWRRGVGRDPRATPARQPSTLLMSGDGKRGVGHRPQATAPILDSTGTGMALSFGLVSIRLTESRSRNAGSDRPLSADVAPIR